MEFGALFKIYRIGALFSERFVYILMFILSYFILLIPSHLIIYSLLYSFMMDLAKKRDGVRHKCRALSIAEKEEMLKNLSSDVFARTMCEIYDVGSLTVYDIKKLFPDSG